MADNWIDAFPTLQDMRGAERDLLLESAQVATLPAGTVIFRPGDACENYMLVADGQVRVQMTSESGREIVLYRVGPGEACILTTACLLRADDYGAEGLAESEVTGVVLPAARFHELLARSETFRRSVFGAFGLRIADLFLLVEEVAFKRLDLRLARLLLERRDGTGVVALTHQAAAAELGSAREVVSRQLKEFERRGWVRLERGRVRIVDGPALERLAAEIPN